jgi:hypothetical protein
MATDGAVFVADWTRPTFWSVTVDTLRGSENCAEIASLLDRGEWLLLSGVTAVTVSEFLLFAFRSSGSEQAELPSISSTQADTICAVLGSGSASRKRYSKG